MDLNPRFSDAQIEILPTRKADIEAAGLGEFLKYDRPDIILKDGDKVILVLERTVEVPSGHNVGQRFGRLVAAAMQRVPVVYFGPYAAYKHGGATAGPRWMNLRLFYSLDKMSEFYDTAITTICWPVDEHYEVVKGPAKDRQMKEYLELFFSYYEKNGFEGLTNYIMKSDLQQNLLRERGAFIENEVTNAEQYDVPPDSVVSYSVSDFEMKYDIKSGLPSSSTVYLYNVGMRKIRSDPYTGMAALYTYLYCLDKSTELILHFPEIDKGTWYAQKRNTKTYRMFKQFSYAIMFRDGFVEHKDL